MYEVIVSILRTIISFFYPHADDVWLPRGWYMYV